MHDRLFDHQKELDQWADHAEGIGIDVASFTSCLDSGRFADGIRKDMTLAQKAGQSGTPGFLIAATDPADPTKVKGISTLRGAQPFSAFKAAIDKALEGSEE